MSSADVLMLVAIAAFPLAAAWLLLERARRR